METPINTKRSSVRRSPLKTPSRRQKLQLLSPDQLVELRHKLLLKEKEIDKEIIVLEAKGFNTDLNAEMQALHRYNDMKDLTQMVLGYLADAEQVTVAELHRRYDLPSD